MTQDNSNKTQAPQTQAPTLGTLLATALGIAYGAWAVMSLGEREFSEEHLPSNPQAKAQSCQVEWGQQSSLPKMAPEPPNSQVASQQSQDTS